MAADTFPLRTGPATSKLRLAVNTGTCGHALGSDTLLHALHEFAGDFEVTEAGCDGACFEAPTVAVISPGEAVRRFGAVTADAAGNLVQQLVTGGPVPESSFFAGQTRSLLSRCGIVDPTDIDSALNLGAYRGLWRALSGMSPEQVIDETEASDLRGRGGAIFRQGASGARRADFQRRATSSSTLKKASRASSRTGILWKAIRICLSKAC
jgi:NADH:ubiquinone oxidoreductase, NADH-binding (51 kD) subunit